MAYPAGSIVAYMQLNTREWNKPLGIVRGDIARLSRLSENLGRKMLALSASIAGIGAIAVREFGKFEHSMRIATSVSNATEKEFTRASDKAIEVSKRWNVAATTVARAYLFLGRAGLTMGEQMNSIEPIVTASKAMLTDLESTTEGVINIIRAFNYTFEQTGQIVGEVTYAANKSTQSLDDILAALSYAGKPAQAANTSFEQLAAALSVAANQGIRGSKAGVALRFAFTSLMRPTRAVTRTLQRWNIEIYDAEHRMKPLPDLLQEIEEGLAGATEQQRNQALATIVGVRATSTWLALLSKGSKELREWEKNISNAGDEAETVAKDQLKALLEKWGQIKKGIQAVVYALVNQFSPGLKGVTDKLIELTTKTEDWIKANKDNVKEMVKSIANLGLLTAKVGLALLLLPKIIQLSAALFSAITSPSLLAVAAIYGLTVVFRDEFTSMFDTVKKFWDDTEKYSTDAGGRVRRVIENAVGKTGIVLGGAAGGAILGSPLGPWGAGVGALGGGVYAGWPDIKNKMGQFSDWAARVQERHGVDSENMPLADKQYPLKMHLPVTPKTPEITPFSMKGVTTPKVKELTALEKFMALWEKTKATAMKDFDFLGNSAKGLIPPEQLALLEKMNKVFSDLAVTLGNTKAGFDETGESIKKALTKTDAPPLPQNQPIDWEEAVIKWKLAVNEVLDTLPSLQEGFHKAFADINMTFRDSIRGWMDDMSNFSGFLKSIYTGILNIIKDFVADAIATQMQLWLFKGHTTGASNSKDLMTPRGLGDIISDWFGKGRGGGSSEVAPTGGAGQTWEAYYEGFATGGIVSKPTLALIGEAGTERVLNPRETIDYERYGNSVGKAAVPNISFNITNEVPGAELSVISAETQADRTVLNAVYRLSSSNTAFRNTFVNSGRR